MNVRIEHSSLAGSGLFANQNVHAGGQVFYLERPTFAAVDSRKLPEVCSYCFLWNSTESGGSNNDGNNNTRMKICTGCRTHRYCSKQCQAAIWPTHRKECKLLGQLASKGTLPNAARLVLQVVCQSAPTQDPLVNLESHLSEIIAAATSTDEAFKIERYKILQIFSRGLYEYTGKKIALPVIEKWFALVYTNALTITSSTFDPLGICIDTFAARANHSCDPNAFLVFDGLSMIFRALKPIKKDEEILISYIDNTRQFAVRQKELSDLYYFNCKCEKCKHVTALKEDHCLKKSHTEPGSSESDTLCVSTSELEQETALMIQRRTEKAYELFEEAKNATTPVETVDLGRQAIQHCVKYGIWPVYRQPLPSLLHEVLVALLSLQKWDIAFKLGFKMYFETYPVLYPETFHPLRVVQKWTLAKLTLLIADEGMISSHGSLVNYASVDIGVVVLGLLLETLDNVKYSHGEKHPFAHVIKEKYEQVVTDMTRGDQGRLTFFEEKITEQWKHLKQISYSQAVDQLIG